VRLAKEGRKQGQYIHRLVLQMFGPPKPPNCEVCHADGDKGNNCITNLRWGTRKENIHDSQRLGVHPKGESHGHAKLTEAQVVAIRTDPRAVAIVATSYGVSPATIRLIKARKTWAHVHG
jgi:hypothetical protein